jgi:hypothetical protein
MKLLGDDPLKLGSFGLARMSLSLASSKTTLLVSAPPRLRRSRAAGDAVSHAIEPTRKRILAPNRPCMLHQNHERGLERILGIVRIGENRPANPPDHRTVPPDEHRERRLGGLLAASHELAQELSVGPVAENAGVE